MDTGQKVVEKVVSGNCTMAGIVQDRIVKLRTKAQKDYKVYSQEGVA